MNSAKTMDATLDFASALPHKTNGCNVTLPLLVILRVYLGVILFITVLGKLTRDNPFATEMLSFLRGVATRRASAPYLHFVQDVVIPHATLFSYLVMTGEAVAALSLLTGTMTRVGAAVAGALDQRHRAHVIELAAPCFRIGRDHALGQFGMKRAFHAGGIACVPTFDVIERRLLNRFVVI